MPLAQLITAEQLARRLDDPALRILDCRFALEDSTYGERSYRQGHVPGARFADLEKDLSGPVTPGVTGRHPLPDPERLAARFRQWGLDDDSDVVLYDDGPGAFAARAWWLLLWLGKRDGIYLLDGGLKAWREAGLPMDEAIPDSEPGTLSGRADSSLIIDASALQERLDDPQLALLDARALPAFSAKSNPSIRSPGISPMPLAFRSPRISAATAGFSRSNSCAGASNRCWATSHPSAPSPTVAPA